MKLFGTKKRDLEDPRDYFRFGKRMLRIWGLWPLENQSSCFGKLYKLYGTMIILTTMLPYNVFSAFDFFYQFQSGNWMDMLPRLSVALAMLLGCVKVIVCFYKTNIIHYFMTVYEEPRFKYEATPFFQPRETINRCIRLYNMQVLVSVGLFGILIMTDIDTYMKGDIIMGSTNKTLRAMPFVNWLPYDYSEPPIYELSFILTNYWFFVSAYLIFVYDTIFMGLMIHTAGQFKILGEALATLDKRAIYRLKRIYPNKMLRRWEIEMEIKNMIEKCIGHHQGIITCVTQFQDLYSLMVFFQFSISCLMICFDILIITNTTSLVSSRMVSLIILLCSMWEISAYCYFGNEIVYQSNQLDLSIYTSNWFEMDRNNKKTLLILMTKFKKPTNFTAGAFVPLDLNTFVAILKASYTYYAFLRKVSDN